MLLAHVRACEYSKVLQITRQKLCAFGPKLAKSGVLQLHRDIYRMSSHPFYHEHSNGAGEGCVDVYARESAIY